MPHRLASVAALAAAASTIATPLAATDLPPPRATSPVVAVAVFDADAVNADITAAGTAGTALTRAT